MESFYSNGKLLITGEYVVLDGAKALALPTKYGQSLNVENIEGSKIKWRSLDHDGLVWFECEFNTTKIGISDNTEFDQYAQRLYQILSKTKDLNPEFLKGGRGYHITTKLDFPRDWGLGSSSTLINNIANWAGVDAYKLLEQTYGGSGYDIACARNEFPIIYQLKSEERKITPVVFDPLFKSDLYFIHLNQKQNSQEAVISYRDGVSVSKSVLAKLNSITDKIIRCNHISEFCGLINMHERLLSKVLKQKTVKELLFSDFDGCLKSLGAWGGDFILAASKTNPEPYFVSKGYKTVIPYSEMIRS